MSRSELLHVRIEPELLARLREEAGRRSTSVSSMARWAILEFLNGQQSEKRLVDTPAPYEAGCD